MRAPCIGRGLLSAFPRRSVEFCKEVFLMTGSSMFPSTRNVLCSICAGHVNLETSKTDELGRAVHENCYVRRTIAMFRVERSGNSARLIGCGTHRFPEDVTSAVIIEFTCNLRKRTGLTTLPAELYWFPWVPVSIFYGLYGWKDK